MSQAYFEGTYFLIKLLQSYQIIKKFWTWQFFISNFKDTHQVLFKACNAVEADTACHEPVPVIFDANCIFHMNLPTPVKIEPVKVCLRIVILRQSVFKTKILSFVIYSVLVWWEYSANERR